VSYRNISYLSKNQLVRLFTWDETGKRIHIDTAYKPYLFLETNGEPDAMSIFNTKLKKRFFNTQFERNRFIKDTSTIRIFGNLQVSQQFLIDTFWSVNETPEFIKHPLKVGSIDIETYSKEKFPNILDPDHEINLITIHDSLSDIFYTWGTKPYTKEYKPNFIYVYCKTEKELLLKFIEHVEKDYYDLISGWNIEYFDIPYIIGRMNKILGENETARLSPVNKIYNRVFRGDYGKDQIRWYIDGVSCVDYIELYKRFNLEKRESYKLDNIGEIEVGENKVDYGTQNLSSLADNDWNTFVDYNVQDVNIVKKLDQKLQYIGLLRMLAYMGLTTLEAALGTLSVTTGAVAIRACHKNQIIPTFIRDNDSHRNPGAFVAEPERGFQECIASFDASSLYPNLMISLNMSPETKIGKIIESNEKEVKLQHVNGQQFTLTLDKFAAFVKQEEIAISKAKILFSQKQLGLFPEVEQYYFNQRVKVLQILNKVQRELASIDKKLKKESNTELEERRKELKVQEVQLDTKQQCLKIAINGAYGYFGNKHAPMGDDDIASSITLCGQATIKQAREISKQFIKEQSGITDETKLEKALIGSDTDSVYLSLKEIYQAKNIPFAVDGVITPETYKLIELLNETLNSKIKEWVSNTFNSKDARITFKREILSDSALFLMKKRYVAHILDNKGIPCDKFKYTGVDVVRTNMPKVIKPHVKKVIETMLMTRDYTKTTEMFNKAYEVFKSLSTKEVAFTMGITDYDKYASQCKEFTTVKRMPIHVKAAYFYNLMLERFGLSAKYEKINSGDKVRYFYISKPNKFGLDAIAFKYNFPEEFKEAFQVNYEKMFEKIVYSAINRFYESVNWQIKDPSNNSQTDLFDLLKS
jgi:DNA polymerase elongation subunit (family B)